MAIGKRTLYIMLPVNLCLWGFIAYKFYSAFNDTDQDIPIENPIEAIKLNDDTIAYQLSLNYPDPFLKEEPKHKDRQNNFGPRNNKPLANIRPKNTATVSPAPSKEIKYLGLIQNKSSGAATALISINGRSYIVKKGEVIEGVNFESISDQSIIAKIGKEKLTINKS